MNLYNDIKNAELYILKKNAHLINAGFCFKKELTFFKGHFPENPILPGIFQIEMVKYSLEKSLDICLHIQSVKKIKFSNLIFPGKTVHIDITITKEEIHQLRTKAILRVGDSIAGKIDMILTEK